MARQSMKILKGKEYSTLGKILKIGPVLVLGFVLLSNVAFAVCPDGSTKTPCPATTPTGVTVNAKIENPLGTTGPQNLPDFIKAIIKIVLIVGVPILVLAIIYSGFLFVKAQGNPGELEVAKRSLLYTVIGGALLLGAFVIATAIGQTVKDIGGGV